MNDVCARAAPFEVGPQAEPGTHQLVWLQLPNSGSDLLNATVEVQLLGDWMRGVVDFLVPLLENYKVLIYSGAYDVILGAPLTEQALRGIQWTGQSAFLEARKKTWTVPTSTGAADLAGYQRVVGNFTQVVVRGAGHMVPGDQPARALDMITNFVRGTPLR